MEPTRDVKVSRVRVTGLDGGADGPLERWGVLVETADGRTLLALPAASPEELAAQVDECGGALALARRRGALPLDPAGLAVGDDGAPCWVPPAAG